MYDEVAHAITQSPFGQFCHQIEYQKRLKFKSLNGEFRSVSSDGARVHGLNCSTVILDECHAHRNSSLYDSLRWAIAARPNGLCILISTAGADQTHWYYTQVYQKSRRVLSGEDLDITHYAQVHEADADGNPEDEQQWKKANPLLGSPWADAEQFRRDCQSAKLGGIGEWLNFRRLRLNQWVRADELCWLSTEDWDKHATSFTADELRQFEASVGLDCSETTDPSSCSICFRLPDNRFFFKSWAWVAEEGVKLREQANLPKYEQFAAAGSLTITGGNLMDYPKIRDHVLTLCQSFNVVSVNADPRSTFVMLHEIGQHGYHTQHVSQTPRHYNGVMKEFHRAYHEGRILHDGSSWLRYSLSNVRVEINKYDEIHPVRNRSVDKIDGAVSCLLAFYGLLSRPTYQPSILW